MRHLCFVGAGVALAFGLSGTAHAVTQTRVTQIPAGAACQLSVPTIDTAVRPRATGFRNEGTTSAFTICGIQDPVGGMVTDAAITFYSLDNVAHTFSCTAVNGWPDSGHYAYSTKTVTPNSSSSRTSLHFYPEDFSGTTVMPNEGYISVTCSLPANVSVGYMYMYYSEDVGN